MQKGDMETQGGLEWIGILEVMDERENGLREGVGIGVKGELVHGAGYDMKYNFFWPTQCFSPIFFWLPLIQFIFVL